MSRPPVIAVRTDVVQRHLVDGLFDAAAARMDDELPAAVDAALAGALEAVAGPDRVEAGSEVRTAEALLARAGYAARLVERERFEPAREPAPWLAERLRAELAETGRDWTASIAAVSGKLARREPTGKPAPDDPQAATWRVPGPGGHVRHLLALRVAQDVAPDGDAAELKRYWTYGFLVRACEEVLPPAA